MGGGEDLLASVLQAAEDNNGQKAETFTSSQMFLKINIDG